jgi:hypothetical protein
MSIGPCTEWWAVPWLKEHSLVYKELRRGRIEPTLATRLSTMLVNHRSMLEVELLERQIEEIRQMLASERAIPLPLITQRKGTLQS